MASTAWEDRGVRWKEGCQLSPISDGSVTDLDIRLTPPVCRIYGTHGGWFARWLTLGGHGFGWLVVASVHSQRRFSPIRTLLANVFQPWITTFATSTTMNCRPWGEESQWLCNLPLWVFVSVWHLVWIVSSPVGGGVEEIDVSCCQVWPPVAGGGGLPSVLNEHRGIVKDRFFFFFF